MGRILVTGCEGQIGSELVPALKKIYGTEQVVGLDLRRCGCEDPFEAVDVTDLAALRALYRKYDFDIVYHMVGILSAKGEQNPQLAWDVNLGALKTVLDLSLEFNVGKVFWPSSIAAFGPSSPKNPTPQRTIMDPSTIYGVCKVAGELLCNYYFIRFGLDVRSIRYPGIISYKTPPGGGTTDYAIAIFHDALKRKRYRCFLSPDTTLPMMYMPDAIKATIDLMTADPESVRIRTSYNLTAVSFSPAELAAEICGFIPEFVMEYAPDHRQQIAASWPQVIDDRAAREDWGWQHEFGLAEITRNMLENIHESVEC